MNDNEAASRACARTCTRAIPRNHARLERARRYLAALAPAIAGDVHTFRVCRRLVRGFALDDGEALALLQEWNTRCQPPWTDRQLEQKIASARRYGREPIGGLLEARR